MSDPDDEDDGEETGRWRTLRTAEGDAMITVDTWAFVRIQVDGEEVGS